MTKRIIHLLLAASALRVPRGTAFRAITFAVIIVAADNGNFCSLSHVAAFAPLAAAPVRMQNPLIRLVRDAAAGIAQAKLDARFKAGGILPNRLYCARPADRLAVKLHVINHAKDFMRGNQGAGISLVSGHPLKKRRRKSRSPNWR